MNIIGLNQRKGIANMGRLDKRQIFLEHFLGLYGVDEIKITKFANDKICGLAIYPDENDAQEFCWHITEDKVPSEELINLIEIIKYNRFNETDKVTVSADRLFEKTEWMDRDKFDKIFNELFQIEVRMIDDGEETDSFFMHD
jgi:hypothetical protein